MKTWYVYMQDGDYYISYWNPGVYEFSGTLVACIAYVQRMMASL